jgi:hypothetical protein
LDDAGIGCELFISHTAVKRTPRALVRVGL